MALKEIEGQPGLFRDTLDKNTYNIRDLPIIDSRLSIEALYERFVLLMNDDHSVNEAIEILVKEINQMEFPEYVKLSPSFVMATVYRTYISFLTVSTHMAAEEMSEYYGDLFNHLPDE